MGAIIFLLPAVVVAILDLTAVVDVMGAPAARMKLPGLLTIITPGIVLLRLPNLR